MGSAVAGGHRRVQVDVQARDLPGLSADPPRAVVTTRERDDLLHVDARLVYGDPVEAEVVDGQLLVRGGARVPVRDEEAEARAPMATSTPAR